MLTGTIATYFLPKKDIRNDSNAVEKNIMESTDITEEEKNNRLYKIFKI